MKTTTNKTEKRIIYLDHSATTYVRDEVLKNMLPYFSDKFGNPGSFNSMGFDAKEILNVCRKNVAKIMSADCKEIIFTGSGTESVNLALQGVARAYKFYNKLTYKNNQKGNTNHQLKGHIITSQAEHPAVLGTCEYLEKEEGFEVTYLKPDDFGMITPNKVKEAIKDNTFLISIMYANNEVGTINPISKISKIIKNENLSRKKSKNNLFNIIFHTDACQAGGLLDLNVNQLSVDLLTLNGSKIYGPKGTGLLYVKKGTLIKPLILGGGQENGLRSSTENIPGIVGFTNALELAQQERLKESKRLIQLRDKLIKELLEKIPDSVLNGHPKQRLPNNVNVSFLNIEGESLLLYMNEEGIQASSGSACSSKSLEASHVLISMGIPYELAHGSIRFSLGKRTTGKDIALVISILPDIVKMLRLISPFNQKLSDL
ncbi:aminotransferase class V-fold PLP-dependent enzyme [archaeon]|jgi:cysteine desulfurase|nr:aminotransferase class V-fold PLP-dependent enzyme [archaeon]MBT3451656.1 aminotransferase class V-fold PLP-dependent enzyme [archaeon]MBT6869677.1 aminotransferase class V-fold PLP-dependent enzyme [archaeon]MBT7192445.1 aminotransferase class V-fold PLP-dependent enzyme [archaeon]MBT7380246.1 aminotransferase class V-fold PLP-dependent enzyme [archaeon]